MIGFLIRRVLQAIVVLFVVSVITFILLHMLPGGEARAVLGVKATPVQIAAFNHTNGLDKSLPVQYVEWLGQVLQGHLGYSYHLNQTVASLIAEKLPKTIVLNAIALIISVGLAIPIGIRQAVKRNKAFDYAATGLSFIFYSSPIFFLALVLVLWFSLDLGWLPSEAPQSGSVVGILSQPTELVLPVLTLVLAQIALFSRYMRSSFMDGLVQDYVRTAKAKGASDLRVQYLHILRNSLIPMATLIGLSLPGILGGALIVEQVFNYPGMGLLFWQEAQVNDYPVLLGVTLIGGAATVVGNLIADVLYGVLDPRVRY
ncbi:ABC transporter permease [Leekyejoonella antrihumi]|uniref:ABC transporter permease n=1 Tax=Leekyejoonella antrihumi TaxID=1660198 RepID=A0A563E606_9MICO|nr:ABC transporter permease [Leekyejoonella antrihumi]TWP37652.1 ABC transporter permease [Leekyejoonella antrihumi]